MVIALRPVVADELMEKRMGRRCGHSWRRPALTVTCPCWPSGYSALKRAQEEEDEAQALGIFLSIFLEMEEEAFQKYI
jgi:hypothetical protein